MSAHYYTCPLCGRESSMDVSDVWGRSDDVTCECGAELCVSAVVSVEVSVEVVVWPEVDESEGDEGGER